MMKSLALLVLMVGVAAANPPGAVFEGSPQQHPQGAMVSPYIYLNRCVGGCTINGGGVDDAKASMSSIPCAGGVVCSGGGCNCTTTSAGTYTVQEFKNAAGQTGSAADAEWNAVVQCVKEVYSPYAVTVDDKPPPGGLSYNMGIIAGYPADIGYGTAGVGGIAPGGCTPHDNDISFTFANIYNGSTRVLDLCYVAAQETGHAYGLEHAYAFTNGNRSACTDPMSYRNDCGGQRFFRNDPATCGEFAPRSCRCSGFQNSHLELIAVFGQGTPITAPPHVTVTGPAMGDQIQNGASVIATAGAQRGIQKMELWLNNYKWLEKPGAAWGPNGQPDTTYSLQLPADVPDGVIDIQVKAFDDLLIEADAPIVTVTKGAPCTSADSCAKGQKCDAGKCYWDTPTGELGATCTYDQFCLTGHCLATSDGNVCTKDCIVGVMDSCPMGFDCAGDAGGNGFCVPQGGGGGGCCSAAGGDAVWVHAGLSALVLGLVARRRRRR